MPKMIEATIMPKMIEPTMTIMPKMIEPADCWYYHFRHYCHCQLFVGSIILGIIVIVNIQLTITIMPKMIEATIMPKMIEPTMTIMPKIIEPADCWFYHFRHYCHCQLFVGSYVLTVRSI
jgi:hypothetical protein